MAKPGQFSFRRILLSRILLLSIPVLLIGEAVTYRKARSSLQETARWNLTESAVKKGENINNAIAALKTSLLVASQTTVLRNTPEQAQTFLEQLAPQLPPYTQCIQLSDIQSVKLIASTCGNRPIDPSAKNPTWNVQQQQLSLAPEQIEVKPVVTQLKQSGQQLAAESGAKKLSQPSNPDLSHKAKNTKNRAGSIIQDEPLIANSSGQLQLILRAPVYNNRGKLQYVLSVQSALHQKESDEPRLLAGFTVIIDQNGTILAHPIASRVGQNIANQPDAERLKSIVKQAIAGRKDFLHLSFDHNKAELLAGYNVIPSPITSDPAQHWVILAVTRLDNALFGLQEIKVILIVLTIGLLGASLLATLYLTRDLARPLEKLRDYALNLESYHASVRVPHNFQIREVEQLAEALDHMVERLKASAEELETAWREAQTSNQSKSEFLATTSHELRTPLNAIIGCIRLVRDGCCDNQEEELEFLERADEAAIHLLGIINDLLDIAKIEAGKFSLVVEMIDLRQILTEVINLQRVHIQQKGLQLITTDIKEPILVKVDPAKLKQVLLNVIGNAVKFTDSGSITIKTQIQKDINDSDSNSTSLVVVSIQDTGVGIDPTQQHKLFRPFVMVDGTTTRKFGGTGLGLAISRNLIELMGGSIILDSAGYGKGTTVEITLPRLALLPTPPPSLVSYENEEQEQSSTGSNASVMPLPEIDSCEQVDPVFDAISQVAKTKVAGNINDDKV